jgi:hypothetical protein
MKRPLTRMKRLVKGVMTMMMRMMMMMRTTMRMNERHLKHLFGRYNCI